MTLLLYAAHLATIAVSAGIGIYVLKGTRFTLAGLAVVTVLASTVMWSVISMLAVHERFAPGSEYPVRMLFWSALLVGGFRSLAMVLNRPAWSPSPRDIINLVAHPVVMLLIATIPALHPILVGTNAEGELYYAWGFWVHTAVGLALAVQPLVRVVEGRTTLPVTAPMQKAVVTVSWVLPAVGYVFSAVVWGPSGPSLTPAFLVIPIALLGTTVVRDGVVDRVPLGREEVFENLAGAVVVSDNGGKVVDANMAARALARDLDGVDDISGHVLNEVCPRFAEILDRGGEADVSLAGGDRVLNLVTTPVLDRYRATVGRCVIVRDVTDSVMQRRELERVRDALANEVAVSEALRLELGAQVVRDSATGVYNRRFLAEALPEIVQSCVDADVALSIAVFDIDDFKSINDSHGHVVGDRVIEAIARTLQTSAQGGTVVRYGGDEFLALLPGASSSEALSTAEAMREACADAVVDTRGGQVHVTVSAGIATLAGEEIDSDELLEVADLALYRAKDGGRNRTWSQPGGAA